MLNVEICAQSYTRHLIESNISPRMACEALLMFKRFIASVALERFLTTVLPHVFLQITRRSASVVALIAFERLFSCVHPHHVEFQNTSCDARILACCTSVWLFTRVHPLVLLQVS